MVINIYTTLNEVRSQDGADGNPTANYSEMKKYAPLHPSTRSWEVARGNIAVLRDSKGGRKLNATREIMHISLFKEEC